MFMALLDVTIVNIAMPEIIKDLDTTVSHASWVLNAYSLVLAVFFLSMGRVADRYGQKRVFMFGIVTFTVFSLLCGFAPSIDWLIAFRAGQGLGGAALLTISLAIVLGAFPKRQQGTAVGIWGALGTAAAAIGPTLGGLLVSYGHWSWIFFVNVPIGIAAVVACALVIPAGVHKAKAEGGIDIPGMLISGVGLFALTLALVEGDAWGWNSATIIGLFVVAVASFPLFMWWETTTASPMFPVNLLRIRSFTAANSAILFIGLAMGGTFLMVVIFLVSVLGYTELRAALALTVMPIVALIVAPNAGRLNDRIGPRFPAAVGAACFGLGLFLLAQLGGDTTLVDVMWRVVFLGLGMGLAMPLSPPPPWRRFRRRSAAWARARSTPCARSGSPWAWRWWSPSSRTPSPRTRSTPPVRRPAYRRAVSAQQGREGRVCRHPDQERQGGRRQRRRGGADDHGRRSRERPQLPGSQPGSLARLNAVVATIYKNDIAESFAWPFYIAGLAGFIAIIPALLTGKRLGEHEGHHEMSRGERLAAAGRAEAAEAGEPLTRRRRPGRAAWPATSGRETMTPDARRSGRRPGESSARGDILEAARAAFAEHGYDRATIRGIAGRAGVDPALVIHYFGSKEALFAEALELPIRPTEVFARGMAAGRDRLGETIVRTFLEAWTRRRPRCASWPCCVLR